MAQNDYQDKVQQIANAWENIGNTVFREKDWNKQKALAQALSGTGYLNIPGSALTDQNTFKAWANQGFLPSFDITSLLTKSRMGVDVGGQYSQINEAMKKLYPSLQQYAPQIAGQYVPEGMAGLTEAPSVAKLSGGADYTGPLVNGKQMSSSQLADYMAGNIVKSAPEAKPTSQAALTEKAPTFQNSITDASGIIYDKSTGKILYQPPGVEYKTQTMDQAYPETYGQSGNLLQKVIEQKASGSTAKDQILSGLASGASTAGAATSAPPSTTYSAPAGSYQSSYKTMQEQAGIPQMKTQIGTFDEEIKKASDLLADLDARIRLGKSREESRLSPMELITGRQQELEQDASMNRNDLLDLIKSSQTGRSQILETMGREKEDILAQLGMREKDEATTEKETGKVEADVDRKKELISKYPQASIGLNDTWELINEKLAKVGTGDEEKWSDPYSLGGDLVQKNLKTGEIRTAVNVAGGGGLSDNDIKTANENTIFQAMQTAKNNRKKVEGSNWDNYLNPDDWKPLFNNWVNSGMSALDFFTKFKDYINPDDI